jgi:hypothetical protein
MNWPDATLSRHYNKVGQTFSPAGTFALQARHAADLLVERQLALFFESFQL